MKQFIRNLSILVVVVIASMSTMSCLGQKFFTNVPSDEEITKITIGKGMLRFANSFYENYASENFGIKDAVKSFDRIELITCESKSKIGAVRKACEEAVARSGYEIASEIEEDNERIHIYMAPGSDESTIVDGIILLIDDRDSEEYVAIYLKGKIDVSKIHNGQ